MSSAARWGENQVVQMTNGAAGAAKVRAGTGRHRKRRRHKLLSQSEIRPAPARADPATPCFAIAQTRHAAPHAINSMDARAATFAARVRRTLTRDSLFLHRHSLRCTFAIAADGVRRRGSRPRKPWLPAGRRRNTAARDSPPRHESQNRPVCPDRATRIRGRGSGCKPR